MTDLPTIFIDGQEGTTGLRIRDLLGNRQDVNIRLIAPDKRKDRSARRELLNEVDLAILCLPDDAAAEALELIEPGSGTRVIDTSTVRRVDDDWVYGIPELSPSQRQAIRTADRVANCGCYPVGFLLAVRPLIEAGLLRADAPLIVNAVSGYSGGGRKMIEAYQGMPPGPQGDAAQGFCLYDLNGAHKHVAEMQKFSGTLHPPLFVPSVDHSYCGMLTSTPISAASWTSSGTTAQQVFDIWQDRYASEPFVRPVAPADASGFMREGRFLDLDGANLTNRLDLFVFGDPGIGLVLVGRQDNLGKGASGNAVQCLNLMLGFDEATGLKS
ncbi:MAG TPA: N-acetyl-gamma-glutamyl-phosphate reductase [Candidatus Latescibacteria bacterium]|nr:N-acetyl-gamma-glutamyl-phosphate reductase [Candidatus Latescibacterota bacterium]|tara:strand:- start:761 stop:1741 length:981 start_codon:yes stop_codon:yes gene_type:complete